MKDIVKLFGDYSLVQFLGKSQTKRDDIIDLKYTLNDVAKLKLFACAQAMEINLCIWLYDGKAVEKHYHNLEIVPKWILQWMRSDKAMKIISGDEMKLLIAWYGL